ncbi:MAG TPA: DUF4349 domain-containing protein [Candidatus Sumerlaeota bacterium]|nr:DUF4349 domain-containing protein [Candidatus Sumerlaeota bacterium]
MTRLLAVLLSLSLLGGCGSRVHYAESAGAYQAAAPPTGARPEAMKASRMTGAIAAPASIDLPSMDVSPAPVAPPATNAGDMDPAKPGAKRKIVYTAHLGLRVPNKRNSADAVRQIVEKHGGFVQNSTLDDITFRVDPKEFDATIAELEALGEVTSRNINSNDITEQYTDVELRLETANSSRQRLMTLLEKATATKDVIEIERDLRRLTEEIETMKGRLRVLSDQVDLATITVHLEEKFLDQAPAPRRTSTPYAWMNETGIDQTLAVVDADPSMSRGTIFCGPKFRLATEDKAPVPHGFVPLEMRRDYIMAGTPEDSRLRVRAFKIPKEQKGDMEFWRAAFRKELADNRGYDVKSTTAEFAMNDPDLEAARFTTEVNYSGEKWVYDAWIIRDKEEPNEFVTVEFARLKANDGKDGYNYNSSIEKAVAGIDM